MRIGGGAARPISERTRVVNGARWTAGRAVAARQGLGPLPRTDDPTGADGRESTAVAQGRSFVWCNDAQTKQEMGMDELLVSVRR